MFRDNEAVLPYWIKEITKFIYYAGPDNIFVSIVESNSGDKSPVLLEEFDAQLESMGVARRILTRDTSIPRPPDMSGTPRIEFLSAVRNRVMEPLVEKGGYEKVIFSNDIYIEAESVVELLKSRDGDWDFVCGLDFGYWGLYDLWVIRDKAGAIPSTNWPYFLEWTGLHAIMRDDPAPAFACWNGIVAFKAEPFLPLELRTPGRLSTSPSKPLAPTHPAFPQPPDLTPAQTPPVRFRASTEKECYSSESFNLPYDFRRQFDLQNIYVNPRVINAYVWEYYVWYKYLLRHWAVKWWMEKIENGYEMQVSKLVIGGPDGIWRWDGGECHPVC
ncbi:cryptococcal mannosyltransferase 1-domain-containing protein [Mycena albidolilacea]|uniref:Cryptococcal mannosyltransferase 1-domain-containing protein n=1 Tax=Mycena albidolilacea TaxID=1033008 RepID=A0AAD7AED1_9AGAR|nr:cryptococcal mannosyltransferase 1-domain-containing protein [Mycena albidolilacea]